VTGISQTPVPGVETHSLHRTPLDFLPPFVFCAPMMQMHTTHAKFPNNLRCIESIDYCVVG